MGARGLGELELEVRKLAVAIDAREVELPTFGRQEDAARPNIEVSPQGLAYVIVERGRELERAVPTTEDDLLYRIFHDVAFSVASRYELAHRVAGADSRRLLFEKQVELLGALSPAWADRRASEIRAILRKHPFDDGSAPPAPDR